MRVSVQVRVVSGVVVGLILLPALSEAEQKKKQTRLFTTRAEVSYGKLTHQDVYRGTFESDERTVRLDAALGPTEPAWGGRISLGPQEDSTYGVTLFPYVFAAYAKTDRFSTVISGMQHDYTLKLSHHYWAAGVGGELQLLRRVLLLGMGMGYSQGYSYFSIPAVEAGTHRTDRLGGTLYHLAVGVRLPVGPVSAGVRLLTDTSVRVLREPLWPLGFPVFYAAITGFVEFDASSVFGVTQ